MEPFLQGLLAHALYLKEKIFEITSIEIAMGGWVHRWLVGWMERCAGRWLGRSMDGWVGGWMNG